MRPKITFLFGLFLLLSPARTSQVFIPGNFIANAGQWDAQARYRGQAGGALLWLAEDAVWLGYPGGNVRLDFGAPLHWQAAQPTGTRYNHYAAGLVREGLPVWGRVYAALAPGVMLSASGAGLWVSGDAAIEVTLSGAQAIAGDGAPPRVRFASGGEYVLPLGGARPLRLNGVPLGGVSSIPAPAAAGNQLIWGTYLGGISWDEAEGLALDAGGNVLIAGQTLSQFFPTSGAPRHNVESFVARFSPDGTTLDYVSVFIGDVEDWGGSLVADAAGSAYTLGRTDSTAGLPVTPGAYDETPNGNFDVFVIKLDTAGELVYGTLLGGGEDEFADGIAVDPGGSVWVAGSTYSDGSAAAAFPLTANAYDNTHNGSRDAFLARLDASGSALLYSTFIGGSGNDHGEALVLRGAAAVITGWTTSPNFAVPAGGYDTALNGSFDAFVFALTPGAGALDFWTYLGGNDGTSITGERGLAIALDGQGSPVIAGSTAAADFPVTPGAFDTTFGGGTCSGFPCADGFAAKISAGGSSLLWATFAGGSGDDELDALALLSGWDVLLGGFTASPDFPLSPNAYHASLSGLSDGVILKLTSSGSALLYGTYLGGDTDDDLNALALDPAGWVYAAGWSNSSDFPTTPAAYDPLPNADKDAVVAVLQLPAWQLFFDIFLPVVIK
jgi:hypothetical protein